MQQIEVSLKNNPKNSSSNPAAAKSGLFKAISVFMSMTMLSRILGFVRDVLIASIFGAAAAYDAFLLAFKIPNFMRRLFAEGAFSQAFIPVLAEYKDRAAQVKFLNHVFTALFTVVMTVVVFIILAAPIVITIFAPGYYYLSEQLNLAANLLRITAPYLACLSICALLAGFLQLNNRFAVPSFSPVLLNLSLIFSALILHKIFNFGVYALAIGVLLGGILQLILHLIAVKLVTNYSYNPSQVISANNNFKFGFQHPGARKILRLMLPAIFGVSVNQINILLDTVFASFLVSGSLSWLYYADRLMELPLGLFGVGIATVMLPNLAKHVENNAQFKQDLLWGLKLILLLGLPSVIGLYFLAVPMISTLFKFGKFTGFDVIQTSFALKAYAPGVLGLMLVKLLVSAFYAKQDMRTPVKIAVVAVLVNAIFNLILVNYLQHAGLALATSIAALTHSLVLLIVLIKRRELILNLNFYQDIVKIILASLLMCGTILLFNYCFDLDLWLLAHKSNNISRLSLIILFSGLIYWLSLKLFRVRFYNYAQV